MSLVDVNKLLAPRVKYVNYGVELSRVQYICLSFCLSKRSK